MYSPLFFAYDYCTPDGIFPNGVDIRFHSEPQNYGRWVESNLQPAFLHFDFTHFTSSVFTSTSWLDYNRHRKFIYPLTTFGGPESWLGGKFTPPNHSSIFCKVSEKTLKAQREGRALFLINQVWEGFCPYEFNIFNRIQDDIQRYGLRGENIIYASANLLIEYNFNNWKNLNPVPDKNLFVPKSVEFFGDLIKVKVKQNEGLLNFPYKEPTYEKDFVCLNRRPHQHRLMLVAELNSKGLLHYGYISCPPAEMAFSPPQHGFNIEKAKEKWEDLTKELPLIVDTSDFIKNHAPDMTSWPYQKAWFSVITETLYRSKYKTIFLSEKIFKPILFYHPFIIVSQPYYLKKLRELGYKTFEPFFDESYDLIEDDDKRMVAICNEIDRLSKLDIEKKKEIHVQIKDIVFHNRNHMLNKPLAFKELETMLLNFVQKP